MVYCQNCGTNLDANSNFCPNCGAALNNTVTQQGDNSQVSDTAKVLGTVVGVAAGASLLGGLMRRGRRPPMPPHGGHMGHGPMGGHRGHGPMGGHRGHGPMGGPGRHH